MRRIGYEFTDHQGRRWWCGGIEGCTIDLLLDTEPVAYAHDGSGGLRLAGGHIERPLRFSADWGRRRLDALEERRATAAAFDADGFWVRFFDRVTASLLQAIDEAERWAAQCGGAA